MKKIIICLYLIIGVLVWMVLIQSYRTFHWTFLGGIETDTILKYIVSPIVAVCTGLFLWWLNFNAIKNKEDKKEGERLKKQKDLLYLSIIKVEASINNQLLELDRILVLLNSDIVPEFPNSDLREMSFEVGKQ